MNDSTADRQLLAMVQAQINQGKRSVVVPSNLLTHVSDLAYDEIRRLCKLCNVKIEVHA